MSSVVVCSQVWMFELSVEFFNVNRKRRLQLVGHTRLIAAVNDLTFMESFDPGRTSLSTIETSFHVNIVILMLSI